MHVKRGVSKMKMVEITVGAVIIFSYMSVSVMSFQLGVRKLMSVILGVLDMK